MDKLGTNYGGWIIPNNINLNENSIVYSGGVGEDISFDLLLQEKYNCNILLIDPTEKAIKHWNEVKEYKLNNKKFTGNIQPDYYKTTDPILKNVNIDKIKFINLGLWSKKDILKFYKQTNPNYVSQSIIPNMFGTQYDIINVDSIKNIMQENNHDNIDLLKLDIEGAEIKVLKAMLKEEIFPKYLCVEFDLKLQKKDTENVTDKLIDMIVNRYNYSILVNDNYNITFIKNN